MAIGVGVEDARGGVVGALHVGAAGVAAQVQQLVVVELPEHPRERPDLGGRELLPHRDQLTSSSARSVPGSSNSGSDCALALEAFDVADVQLVESVRELARVAGADVAELDRGDDLLVVLDRSGAARRASGRVAPRLRGRRGGFRALRPAASARAPATLRGALVGCGTGMSSSSAPAPTARRSAASRSRRGPRRRDP